MNELYPHLNVTWETRFCKPPINLFPGLWCLHLSNLQDIVRCFGLNCQLCGQVRGKKYQLIEASTSISLSIRHVRIQNCLRTKHSCGSLPTLKLPETGKTARADNTLVWKPGTTSKDQAALVGVCSSSGWGLKCSNKRHSDESESSPPLVFQQKWSEHHPTSGMVRVKHVHTPNSSNKTWCLVYRCWQSTQHEFKRFLPCFFVQIWRQDWVTKAMIFPKINVCYAEQGQYPRQFCHLRCQHDHNPPTTKSECTRAWKAFAKSLQGSIPIPIMVLQIQEQ